ncbi:hypothetical protein PR048_030124 [Dryococelus australis]|uniref:DDE Tnp4 domain-containing protein n=1 Tax=Dryococelus australis TaxID=614101 RepID=A0ABQ9GAQ2_9NEOP|nr:hypothetical protein PR048_030124 [Dryococelus australis]
MVNEVSAAVWNCMQPIYLPRPSVHIWEKAAQEFKQKWHFPHCIGSVDGRHIVMKNVPNAGSAFFNYKGTFYTILIATVDAKYKFTSIDVGSYDRLNDSTIFRSSVLGDALHCKTLPTPPPAVCSGFTYLLPYVFVGDEAFPLMENLMRPYPRCSVTGNMDNKVFNYRLSRARQTVECAFGIMASKFRAFRKPFEMKLEIIDCIGKVGCVLHNYSRAHTTSCEARDDNTEEMFADQLLHPSSQIVRPTTNAFHVRENFISCFNTSGAVPWQRESVLRGKY